MQGFRASLNLKLLAVAGNHRQTATVDGHAFADRQGLVQTGPGQCQSLPRILFDNFLDPAKNLHQPREHASALLPCTVQEPSRISRAIAPDQAGTNRTKL